ncbi:glycosyltransferase family 9 protein [Sulfuriroseicoccus oceanibius]|uniref:Glycosyltransferase family 9 protein n=1 Tax=Sulfuriroseicoccus oceanibius TaxID=2707525 RepID=A0A6B3L792_9BACT|nr:glycosyltransferase family 9 protein [Sulfuriroseicoccus oceanibius]QQL45462.1 glycosyltransferase family 9 protein [Sulfuriroseicoccus oceanibius]
MSAPIRPIDQPADSLCGVDFSSIQRVLVVKPSSMGDVVHTLPAVNALKQAFPHLEITWVVNPEWASLLADNPDLAGVVEFPRRHLGGPMAPVRFARWAQLLHRPNPPEVALDFQGLLRSALISRFSHARHIIGLRDAREGSGWFYDFKVDTRECIHAVDRYLELVASCGVQINRNHIVTPLPEGDPVKLPDGVTLPDSPIMLHPYSRGEGKSMTTAQLERLIERLSPAPVVLIGKCDDAEACAISSSDRVINLLNRTTIPQLIHLLRRAGMVISVDSGPMHLAAALGGPLLSIHTWSDPRKVGPYRPDASVWKAGKIMRMDELDPRACEQNMALDDDAIDAIAAWATPEYPLWVG